MQRWQTTYLGMRELPREISEFEMQALFTLVKSGSDSNFFPASCRITQLLLDLYEKSVLIPMITCAAS